MTDALKQAAQQALEAMELYPVTVNHWKAVLLPAAEALRAALAAPQPAEPQAFWHAVVSKIDSKTHGLPFDNSTLPAQSAQSVTDDMVQRFLGWRLPSDFSPDCGISFRRVHSETSPFGPQNYEPTGTNLFTAVQARAMLEHVLEEDLARKPIWTGADEEMFWLNEIEKYQGGSNGPTIKLRAAILAATPQPAAPQADQCAPPEIQEAIKRGEFEPGQWTVSAKRAIEQNPGGALRIIAKLRDQVAAMKAAPAPAQPVAQCEEDHPTNRYLFKYMAQMTGIELGVDTVDIAVKKIAAFAKPAAPAPAQAVPLTRAQIEEIGVNEELLLICDGTDELIEIARAVERAHGIKQPGSGA